MTTITFRIESLKAVIPFISKEERRYQLRGVFFQKNLMIATDGHRMAVVKDLAFSGEAKDFIFPEETITKLLRVKPESKHFPVWIKIDTQAHIATACQGDLEDQPLVLAQFPYTPVAGTFPDWKRVIPPRKNVTGGVQGFNAKYLGDFKSFGETIAFYTNAESGAPAAVFGKTAQFEAFGVLMPVREEFHEEWPEWIG